MPTGPKGQRRPADVSATPSRSPKGEAGTKLRSRGWRGFLLCYCPAFFAMADFEALVSILRLSMDRDFDNAVIDFALWRDPERVAEVIASASCQL